MNCCLEISGFWLGFELELDDHFVTDEVIRFSRIHNAEILAVDVELGVDLHGVARLANGCREADVLGLAVKGEISRDGVSGVRLLFDAGDIEFGFREFLDVEEVRALEVAGEFFVVGEGGFHVDDDLVIVADRSSVLNGEVAGEGLEAAAVAAGDFRAGEVHLRGRGEDILGAGGGDGAGFLHGVGHGGGGGFVRRIFARDEDSGCGDREGEEFGFHGLLFVGDGCRRFENLLGFTSSQPGHADILMKPGRPHNAISSG